LGQSGERDVLWPVPLQLVQRTLGFATTFWRFVSLLTFLIAEVCRFLLVPNTKIFRKLIVFLMLYSPSSALSSLKSLYL
jgi:hypothetical protein